MTTILVTGAAGFIGSAVCRYLRNYNFARVIGIDKMGYAASRDAVGALEKDTDFQLIETDICDGVGMEKIFATERPAGVMHLAAETHVDRSIDRPGDFVQNNLV